MKIRLLVVDDSVAFRMFLRKAIMGLDEVEVVGVARDGLDALEKIEQLKPDAITLDMNMPRMNGMETLIEIKKKGLQTGVIIVAAETEDDADRTVQALNAGAFDFILKPKASETNPSEHLRHELLPRLKSLWERLHPKKTPPMIPRRMTSAPQPIARVAARPGVSRPSAIPSRRVPAQGATPASGKRSLPRTTPNLLAIGSSTGGPAALHEVLPKLPGNLPVPALVVQHMPELFIRSLAARMDKDSPLSCKVAEEGERLQAGHVYFAPGGWHMEILYKEGGLVAHLNDSEPLHFCRPAVDATYNSLTALLPHVHTLAVVLTGMGKDGAAGALKLADHEGYVIAQDKASSTVWGMPGSTVALGAAHRILPLTEIPKAIISVLSGKLT